MGDLDREIDAFEQLLPSLEARFQNRWVLIHGEKLIDDFETFDSAADEAVRRFGHGPFLIRQIGAVPETLPISVIFPWRNAQD